MIRAGHTEQKQTNPLHVVRKHIPNRPRAAPEGREGVESNGERDT